MRLKTFWNHENVKISGGNNIVYGDTVLEKRGLWSLWPEDV